MTRRRVILLVGLTLSFVGIWSTIRLFINPAVDEPVSADAVVMLAGGRGERLDRALALIEADVAPVLVIMNGTGWSKGREACLATDLEFEVLCPDDAETTREEAQEIALLADEHGWTSVTLVTSDYHMHRASTLVNRCFDGEVSRVAAENRVNRLKLAQLVAYEWAGTIRSWVLRAC